MNFTELFYKKMNVSDVYAVFEPGFRKPYFQFNGNKLIIVDFENVIFRIDLTKGEIQLSIEENENETLILENKNVQKAIEVFKSIIKEYKLKSIF